MRAAVAITGLGLTTALGHGREATWARLRAGGGGIRRLAWLPERAGAAVDGPSASVMTGDADAPTPAHALARAAASEALDDAGVHGGARREMALLLGNSTVEYDLAHKLALRRGGAAAGGAAGDGPYGEFGLGAWLAARLGLAGSATLASNCVASLQAMILGAGRILAGRAERVLVGGADRTVTPEMLARFDLLRALARSGDPTCCRPFDRAHAGMVLGDGAGFLVLEAAAAVRARRATVHAWLVGWGMTSDAHHPTRGAPDGGGKAEAIRATLAAAHAGPADVELVCAHGTGTVDNDGSEVRALRRALGAHAEEVPITALKAALGHSLAASGALESGLTVLMLRDGVVPPVLHLMEPAADCALGGFVRAAAALAPRLALKTAFAFGGFNACVALRAGDAGP